MESKLLEASEIKIKEEDIDSNDESCEGNNHPLPRSSCLCHKKHFKKVRRRRTKSSIKLKPVHDTIEATWQEYIAVENSLPSYYCSQCAFETKWKCYLKNHVKNIHATPEEARIYHCMNCSFKTKWKFSLRNHMKVHSDPDQIKMFKCTRCDYQTKWNNGLTSHMKVHMLPKIMKVTVYKCTDCLFQCTSKQSLSEHRRTSHAPGNVVYKCPLCMFTTKFRHGVNKHVKVHNMMNLM